MRIPAHGRLFPYTLIVAVMAAMVWTAAVSAQVRPRFHGRVINESTGQPIEGATISIPGDAGSARTDRDGRFAWEPAPAPPFQVIVVLPGGQVARPVQVDALQDELTVIPVSPLADEAITVLGAAPSIDSAPASGTTILSATQIARRNPETLMQALETVPGVAQVSEGHAAVPAVRGLARGRTLLLIDGGRVSSERRVGPSASFLDPSAVEGIDVARGPGSVAYGSDALGGVISVRTRRAEPGSPLRVRFSGTYGAGVPEGRGSVEVSKGLPRGGILAQARVRNAEDYDSPDGKVFNSGWEDHGVMVHLTHAIAKGFLSAAWQSDFARDVERPRNNSQVVRFFNPFEDSHRFTASYEVPDVAGFRQIALTGFVGSNTHRTDQDRFATSAAGRVLERADMSANDFQLKGTAERQVGKARLELGVDLNGRYDLEAVDTVQRFDLSDELVEDVSLASVENARRMNAGVFVQAEAALTTRARISGGIRGDRVTTRNTGGFFGDRASSNGAAAGFGAVTLGPFEGVSFTAQVSRGFRDPVLSDRYFSGPSGRGFITGNPDLKPETSVQVDLATRYTLPRAQVAVYFYHYRIDDLIERYQTEIDFFFFRNRGRARLRGFEFEAAAHLGRGYSLEATAQIARGDAPREGGHLDDVAPDSVALLARKEFGERVYAQVRLAVHAEDPRPGPSEVAAPGATLVDASGGWRVTKRLQIRGAIRNLLDETYYASPDPRFVLAPGRSASVTAVVQF